MRRLIALLLLAAAPAIAQTATMTPAAAVSAAGRPEADLKLDASRKPAEMLALLDLKPGQHAADLVAGGGYYTELMARVVGPSGWVVASNPASIMQAHAEEWKGREARLPNIRVETLAPDKPALTPNSLDRAMIHLVYHDFYWESAKYNIPRTDPNVQLARLFGAMKHGGKVLVIDHAANPGGDTRAVVDALHRIDPATVKADFARAGFKLETESRALRMPGDDHTKLVFDPAVRGMTDRVVYLFAKP